MKEFLEEDPYCVYDIDVVKEFLEKEGNPPQGEWRPKDGNPFVLEWHGMGEIMAEAASQNAPVSHTVAPGSTQMPHPYPPYGSEEIVAPEGSSDFLG